MSLEWEQFKVILWKNFLISKRTKEYLRENISVVILGVFLVLIERESSNNLMSPFYMSLAVMGYTRATGLNWVMERETRQKELQKIMGMTSLGYVGGWLIYFILNALAICTFMMLILWFGVIGFNPKFLYAEGYGFVHIVIIYLAYALSLIGFILMISNFFDRAKTAAQGIIFIQLVLNFLYFLRFSNGFRQS